MLHHLPTPKTFLSQTGLIYISELVFRYIQHIICSLLFVSYLKLKNDIVSPLQAEQSIASYDNGGQIVKVLNHLENMDVEEWNFRYLSFKIEGGEVKWHH